MGRSTRYRRPRMIYPNIFDTLALYPFRPNTFRFLTVAQRLRLAPAVARECAGAVSMTLITANSPTPAQSQDPSMRTRTSKTAGVSDFTQLRPHLPPAGNDPLYASAMRGTRRVNHLDHYRPPSALTAKKGPE